MWVCLYVCGKALVHTYIHMGAKVNIDMLIVMYYRVSVHVIIPAYEQSMYT